MSLKDRVMSILEKAAKRSTSSLFGGTKSNWSECIKKHGNIKEAQRYYDKETKKCNKKPKYVETEWNKCVKRYKGTKNASKYYKDGICHDTIQKVEKIAEAAANNPTHQNVVALVNNVLQTPELLSSPVVI